MSKHGRTLFCLAAVIFLIGLFTGSARAGTVRVLLPEEPVGLLSGSNGGARFEGENLQFPGQTGEPNLPYRVLKILLPSEADLETVSVSLENVVETEVGGLWDVSPVPPMATWDGEKVVEARLEDGVFQEGRDVEVYGTDASFPEDRTLPARTGEVRGWKVVDVPVALFRYNPVTRKLVQLEEAEVVVDYSAPEGKTAASGTFGSDVPDRVRDLLVNYDEMVSEYGQTSGTKTSDDATEMPGYIIITTEAIQTASDSMDEFVTHKESEGFDVEVVTEDVWGGGTGDDAAENIRSWLADNYLALDAEYVLLIGNPNPESGDVPMKMLWPMRNSLGECEYGYYSVLFPESPSDLYYADLTGNWDLDGDGYYGEGGAGTDKSESDFGDGGIDTNWEVVVGRIPVYDTGEIDDLDAILSKTIRYATADSSATEWRRNALLPMKPSDDSTPGYQLGEEIKDDVLEQLGYDGYVRVYDDSYGLDPEPDYTSCTIDNVTTAWTEDAFGLVSWWTHGSPTVAAAIMDVDHAPSLDDEHPSMVFQCSCLNAYPEYDNNLSYGLLKNGAVVTIGATRVSWYSVGQTEFAGTSSNSGMTFDFSKNLLFHGMDAGTALASLKEEAYSTNEYFWMNFTDFNLFGDPSLSLKPGGAFTGSVTVTIDGPEDARWLVNRADSYESGETVNFVSGVTYEISFSDVDGWVKPDATTCTLSTDVPLVVEATYEERTLTGPTFVRAGGTGDGSSWESPKELADALKDSMSGETILVAEGLYLPKYDKTNNVPREGDEQDATFTLKSGVTLLGGFPDNLSGTERNGRDPSVYRTVLTGDLGGDDETDARGMVTDVSGLNGDNATHVVYCYGASDLSVDGITVTAGHADGSDSGETDAAGMYASYATFTLTNCSFIGNSSIGEAGGLATIGSEAELESCSFSANEVGSIGGGLYAFYSTATFEGCSFSDNEAGSSAGGAIVDRSTVTFEDCSFSDNKVGSSGGGFVAYYSTATLEDCSFSDNEAGEHGGGTFCYGSLAGADSAVLRGCTFSGNVSGSGGGAFYYGSDDSLVENCTFSANRSDEGSAIYAALGAPSVTNCTFTENRDNGQGETVRIESGTQPVFTNCLFWDETDGEIYFSGNQSSPIVSYCVIRGGTEGILGDAVSDDHVISDDPRLGPLADNGGPTLTCVLMPGSSAIDAGTSVDVPVLDQRDVARPQCDGFDIGACEDRPGAVTVSFEGPEGARWSLDGEGAYASGATVEDIAVGAHTVDFSAVQSWSTPSLTGVTVYEGVTVGYRASYGLDVACPGTWSGMEPGDGVILSWEPFAFLGDSVTYQVYMLEDGSFVQVPADRVDGTSVTLDLNGHTTYTLRIDADGFEGQPWTFTTANRAPVLARRSPTDGTDRLPVNTVLSWLYVDPDGDSVDYDLYLGPDTDTLAAVMSADTATTYSPALSSDCEYAWQIVAMDRFDGMADFTQGVVSSDVWTFAVTSDVSRITAPVSDDVLIACGVNDIWVATLNSADLAALGDGFIPVVTVLSMDVAPLSCDLSSADRQEFLEGSGTSLATALTEGFRLALSVSDDVNLVPVPVTLSFTEKQVGRPLSKETLLDDVHLFVVVGGTVYDLVTLAGDQRDSLFTVTSDADESGVTYFVSFRLYLAAGGSAKTLGAAGVEGTGLFTDTEDPAFLVEGASPQTGRFEATVAEGVVPVATGGGGGCSAFGFGPGAVLLVAGVLLVIRGK